VKSAFVYLSKFDSRSPGALVGFTKTYFRPLFFCEARHAARALSFSDLSIAFSNAFKKVAKRMTPLFLVSDDILQEQSQGIKEDQLTACRQRLSYLVMPPCGAFGGVPNETDNQQTVSKTW